MDGYCALVMHSVSMLMIVPDSKGHGANMGHIWGQQDPGGPRVGPMNFAIWGRTKCIFLNKQLST